MGVLAAIQAAQIYGDAMATAKKLFVEYYQRISQTF